ncbi:hypothetical protein ACFWEJ_26020, partial [Promicromonospora sp. NPDC060204]
VSAPSDRSDSADTPHSTGAVGLGSVADAHWVAADLGAPDHGSGRPGVATVAGRVTTVSIVRGAWEVRLVRVADDVDARATALQIGGWAAGPGLDSTLVPLLGDVAPVSGTATADDATPLAGPTTTPWLRYAPVPEGWTGAAVHLGRTAAGDQDPPTAPAAAPHLELTAGQAVVTWPDGERTTAELPTADLP